VINTDGKVFAIITAMATQSSHIGFAIPLSQKSVLTMLSDIKLHDKIISSK
jgi:S1-C subfamily serine protease